MRNVPMSLRTASRGSAAFIILGTMGSLAACADLPTVPAGESAPAFSQSEVMFNPQPDPPHELMTFTIDNPNLIPDERSWRGTLLDAAGQPVGSILVIPVTPVVQDGQVLRLDQEWHLGGDEGTLATLRVAGQLNLSSGRLVLNGADADGRRVHVQGWMSSGGASIGGELMFNPQPDPPLEG